MVTFGNEACILGDKFRTKVAEMTTSKNLSSIQAVKQNKCWNTIKYEVEILVFHGGDYEECRLL
jgi:hypothetical protein